MVEHQPAVPPLGNTPGTSPSPARAHEDGADPGAPGSLAAARAVREAMRLARLGYVLVPVTIRRSTDGRGKKDAEFHRGWRAGGSSRPDQIRDWGVQHPGCSFAILCGPSGIEVVDLDAAEGGPQWWTGAGMPSSAVVVDTPGGGAHLYWRRRPGAEPDDRLVNNAGAVAPGVDARTVGGLVFAPGSFIVGEEDRPYTARTEVPEPDALEQTPRAVLGLWSRARVARPREFAPGVVDQARAFTVDEARAYVAREAREPLLAARYGENVNDTINRAALVLGHFIPAGFWTADQAHAVLRDWILSGPGRRNGWVELDHEDEGSITSGLRRGMAEPYAMRTAPGSNHLADGVPEPAGCIVGPEYLPTSTKTAGPGATSGNGVTPVDRFAGLDVPEPGSAHEVTAMHSSTEVAGGGAAGALGDLPPALTPLEVALERGRIARQVRRILDAEERPASAPPASTSLTALLAEPDEGAAYLVQDLWPAGGKVLLAAPQKAGKTTLVGNLVRALADGVPFLAKPVTEVTGDDWKRRAAGYAVPTAHRVFVLDFEMTRRKVREWLTDQRIVNTGNVMIETMRGRSWDVRVPEVRSAWAAHVRGTGADVLIVDPIGPVLHGLGIDENDNSAVGGFLAALDALVLEAGVGELFVVHHTGHGSERARGASSFLGWPDANWRIVREELGNVRGFAAEGRDVYVPETVTEYDPATRRLWLGQGSRAESRGGADAEAVVPVLVAECADRGPGQEGPSQNALKSLLKDALGWGNPRAEKAIRAAFAGDLVHVHEGAANRAKPYHPGPSCPDCPTPS